MSHEYPDGTLAAEHAERSAAELNEQRRAERTPNRITTTGDNECTAYPWWAIVDPRHGLVPADDRVHHVASQITGPFFSRASAEATLEAKRHRFGRHAKVYCFSGHMSPDYTSAMVGGVK